MTHHPTEPVSRSAEVSALRFATMFVLAAGYFAASILLPLGWFDEGQIVYPSWRVSQGAVPYREFRHLYGPSLFYWNGGLMRLFGGDLLVLRVSMVVVKALTAVFVYALTLRVAPRPFAGLAFAIAVLAWGLPIPPSAIPYANYHAQLLVLIGAWLLLGRSDRRVAAYLAAGLCFGLAATFKQTTGIFATVAVVLFGLTERGGGELRPSRAWTVLARWSRIAVLIGSAGLFAVYLAPANSAWNLAVLTPPLAILLYRLARAEWSRAIPPGAQAEALHAMVAVGSGFVVAPAAWAIVYAAQGLLEPLVFNTVSGAPQAVSWFVPFPAPTIDWVLWGFALGGGAAVLWLWERGFARAVRWPALAALAIGLVALVYREVGDALTPGIQFWTRANPWFQKWWFWAFSEPYIEIGPAVAWAGAIWFAATDGFGSLSDVAPSERRGLSLLCYLAATGLFLFYPAADAMHAFTTLPVFLPLLAAGLHELVRRASGPTRTAAIAYAVVVSAVVALPSVADWVGETARQRSESHRFARATGIAGGGDWSASAAELMQWLDEPANRGRPVFSLKGRQILYFLSGRVSPVERSETGLYLMRFGLLPQEHIPLLIDEDDVVRMLREVRPIVLDDHLNAVGDFRKLLPRAAQVLSEEYESVRRFGVFEVFTPKT